MPEDSTAKVDEEEEVAVPYMLMKVAPFIRTPLTDIVAHSMTYQSSDACPDFEMRTVECIEAYGLVKGKQKCKDYMADLEECLHKHKQRKRIEMMLAERKRQLKTGERSPENRYDFQTSRVDGY